jgi:sugar lactone lactonase YvrE
MTTNLDRFEPIAAPAARLGESPLWHPQQQCLYWCDIPGRAVHRWDPAGSAHRQWDFDAEPASLAPLCANGLLVAMRDGLWRLDTGSGERRRLAAPPYDPTRQRFNDGKADPQGRFWVGTLDERRLPDAALYCWDGARLHRRAAGVAVGNGLAFAPDGRTLYWADTRGHQVLVFDFDGSDGSLSNRRVFKAFAPRDAGQPLSGYGGRPDGAAMDSKGGYWVAMFEGRRLLRLTHDGEISRQIALPVQCPTMPCFGGADLRTLYLTTSRENRPVDELARDPWAGCVLATRVDVPGLPAHQVAH